MNKFKQYLICMCIFFVVISFFSSYAVMVNAGIKNETETEPIFGIQGDEDTLTPVQKKGNFIATTTDGGSVTITDGETSWCIEDEFCIEYEVGTMLELEVVPNYNYYIENIIVNGIEVEYQNLETIDETVCENVYETVYKTVYERISDISIIDDTTTVEVVFSKYPDSMPLADGDTVQITKGVKYEYGGYYTHEYWIHADGYKFLGTCVEPVKEGPDGVSFTAAKITDPIFRYLMWCYQNEGFREEAFGSVEPEKQFILLHTTLGYYYCGEQGFGELENSGSYWINKAEDVLNWVRKIFYASKEERYVNARTAAKNMFDIYMIWGGEHYQDIVWLQPKNVDLTISKKSKTDINFGERYLTGAVFELYAWDGAFYKEKIATSVDQGDGTYIFPDINYMMTENGKFLVREVNAPEGYSKSYYIYNAEDDFDYKEYGGREFVLDKSYQTWFCDSTQDYEDSSAGFSFLDTPKQITMVITKVDAESYEKLIGASFDLYAYKNGGYSYFVGNFGDNQDGTYSITFDFDLAEKNQNGEFSYLLKETKAPEGYHLNDHEIEFSIKKTGEISVLSSEIETDTEGNVKIQVNKEGNIDAVIKNQVRSSYQIQIIKVNDKGTLLKDAEFTLFSDSACTQVVAHGITDEKGQCKFESLVFGRTYYLKEAKAPEGYMPEEKMMVYEIKGEFSTMTQSAKFFVNNTEYNAEDMDATQDVYISGNTPEQILNIKIKNSMELLLPETGSGMSVICFCVGVAMMLLGLGVGRQKLIK